jgi:seryl-tRNA synthetase
MSGDVRLPSRTHRRSRHSDPQVRARNDRMRGGKNLPKRVQAIYALTMRSECQKHADRPTPALALTGASEETIYELIECLCPLKIHGVATLRYEINLCCRHEAGKDLRQEEWVSGILAANDEKSRRR